MSWVEVFLVFLVLHLVGDFILQTEWQATNKFAGLSGNSTSRRALCMHVLTYTLAFAPAFIWIGDEESVGLALAAVALVALPHLVIDDGRLLAMYMRAVKHTPSPPAAGLVVAVDQSFHIVCLFAAALLIVA